MDTTKDKELNSISFTRDELERLMQQVAQDAAARALGAVGLSDENAGKDIQDIRALIRSYRVVKAAVWKTILEKFIGYFVVAVMAALAVKCSIDLDKFR